MAPGANWAGVLIFFACFLPGIVARKVTGGKAGDDLWMFVGGLLVVALDAVYRLYRRSCPMWDRHDGATFLFLPIWVFGLFWIMLGFGRMAWLAP
jgi:hypothetical protein